MIVFLFAAVVKPCLGDCCGVDLVGADIVSHRQRVELFVDRLSVIFVIVRRTRVEAAQATERRILADIDDSELKAPRDGRIQYRVAEPGEVLAAGGRVLNMVDLADVYMTFFLPTEQAGLLALGSEARLVLDAAPDLVIPANISFVASVAQFTPKTVETSDERLKLMFRVKARIPPELLAQHLEYVKTGLPGMAYVRLDKQQPWPEALAVRLPQ